MTIKYVKYVLKSIDENEDELSATITYEFQADYMHNVLEHITAFLRASGFTWLEGLETVEKEDDSSVDRTEPEDDVDPDESEKNS
jgi:hypothetical protein